MAHRLQEAGALMQRLSPQQRALTPIALLQAVLDLAQDSSAQLRLAAWAWKAHRAFESAG